MYDTISEFLSQANGILWGWFMIFLLMGTHLFFTVRTGFVQRHLGRGIRLSLRKSDKNHPGDVSHFSSLMIAMAATVGVGNIVGVATAVQLGGPGAVLWCWVTGLFGIATKYGEAVLAIKYRVKRPNGTWAGGPMYALERGVGSKFLAVAFCVFTVLASFGIGNMTQANTIADVVNYSTGIPLWVTGLVCAGVVGAVILGGIQSIAAVCRKMIPFMIVLYVLGCIILLILQSDSLWPALTLIGRSAFSPEAAGGGLAGGGIILATRYGIARGLFSNESGMGSAPIVAAAARTKIPAEQGLVSMTGTFWDTVVICALTGLTLVTGMVADPASYIGLEGVRITYQAFSVLPFGEYFLMLNLVLVTSSTLLGWSYYGERSIEYLTGGRGILAYRIAWVVVSFIGATTTLQIVWDFSDFANALMVLPNVIALFFLHKVIRRETISYLKK